ncbi:3159_t:CDS:2, partial [Funneliformis mosseae]
MDKKFDELIAYDNAEDFSDTDGFNDITRYVDAIDAVDVTDIVDVTNAVDIIDVLELFVSKTFQNWDYVAKFMKKYATFKGYRVQIGGGSK